MRRWMIAAILLISVIMSAVTISAVPGYAFYAPAYVPTNEKLEEVKTAHFHIVYQKPLQAGVPYLAEQCEEAYQALTSIFNWYPHHRIEVLFTDAMDTHNGWATAVPDNRICIYASAAEPRSAIFQPGNYLRGTVYHELTHVLNMDMRYGYDWVFSSVFGKMLPVNADPLSTLLFFLSTSPVTLAPNWYLEGVAIWSETEFTNRGRGRASIPDMIFRCAVQDHNLLLYRQWDLDIPHWPYGLGAYLYGMKLIQYISETSNELDVSGASSRLDMSGASSRPSTSGASSRLDISSAYNEPVADSAREPVGDLVQSLAHNFMFNFDSHSVKVTGYKFETLVQKMLLHEMRIQEENITELRKLALTETPRLTDRDLIVSQPVFAGGKIYFAAREEEARDSLYVYIPEQNRTQKIACVPVTAAFGSLSASPGGRFIYYTRLEVQNKDDFWYEVRRFDTESQKDILVTDEGRYRSIDVSPDGLRLAAVSMRAGKSFLIETSLADSGLTADTGLSANAGLSADSGLVEAKKNGVKKSPGEKENILACGAFQESFDSPRYSPDGKRIAYVRGDEEGFSLIVFDLEKGSSQLVYHSRHQVVFPRWHHENIVFSSDENGVYNLYEISTGGTGEPVPLTHVLGGIFAPDFAPDGSMMDAPDGKMTYRGETIAAVAYDSSGYYLTLLPYQPQVLAGRKLPCIRAIWKGKKRGGEQGGAEAGAGAGLAISRIAADAGQVGNRTAAYTAADSGQEESGTTADTLGATSKPYSSFKPYSSLKNIRFDYWGPWLTASSYGVEGGFGAAFSDPTGYQNLQLIGGLESEYGTTLGAVQYAYKGWYPNLYLYASQDQQIYPYIPARTSDGKVRDYVEEDRTIGVALDIPLIKRDHETSLQIGYQVLDRDSIEEPDYNRYYIRGNLSEESEGSVWARLSYFDGTAFGRSSSIEDGRFVALTAEQTDTRLDGAFPKLGGDFSRTRMLGEWNEYISNPWVKNHVLKLSGCFGLGRGERIAQGMFGLGGFGSSIVSTSLGMPRSIPLRGYGENFQIGDTIAKASCAYRFPLQDISEGVSGSVPVYYKQVFAEVFYDGGMCGNAGVSDNRPDYWINSLGLEVNFGLKLLRFGQIAPGLGFVYAPNRPKNSSDNDDNVDERFQIYVTIKGFVNF